VKLSASFFWKHLFLSLSLLLATSVAVGQETGSPAPEIQDLGNGLVRIGSIELDRNRRQFTATGKLLRHEGPLEYLAVTRGGLKAYESLLELDANAFEFNMACIIIGLDSAHAKLPRYFFDEAPVEGDSVAIHIIWQADGKESEIDAEQALINDGKPIGPAVWSYTGSSFTPENDYMAATDGTLIGLAHDPASIIEHRKGLGIGSYGAVAGEPKKLPEVGTRIRIKISVKIE